MIVLSKIDQLYDGRSSEANSIQRGWEVWIDDSGHIAATHPAGSQKHPDAATVIDCSSLTVTPGLVDCHSHLTVSGISGRAVDIMNSQAALIYVEKILWTTLVDGGATTVRDIGGATDLIKRLVHDDVVVGPRMKIAICMLSTTGGHADFRGPDRCHAEMSKLWPEAPGRPSSIVDNPWECRKRVREVAACGADLIKLCTSPGVASPSDHLENRDFSQEEIEAICDEAEARGLKVAAHAHSRSGIDLAIRSGVYDIQHISFMDEEQAERAYQAGCVVTPTSWVMSELIRQNSLDPFVKEKAEQCAASHGEAVKWASKSGLKILAGTDPVLPRMHGRNYMELVHLIAEGVAPMTAWHGATGLAAEQIGQEDVGTVEVGKWADLLVARGDVLKKPEEFDRGAMVEVIKGGEGYRGGLAGLPQRTFQSNLRASLDAAT